MKNLVLIESILCYLKDRKYLLITQVCPWILNSTDWECISKYQKLSEEFITKFQEHVDWYWISAYQTLSEEFITKFQDKVDWYLISRYQTISNSDKVFLF